FGGNCYRLPLGQAHGQGERLPGGGVRGSEFLGRAGERQLRPRLDVTVVVHCGLPEHLPAGDARKRIVEIYRVGVRVGEYGRLLVTPVRVRAVQVEYEVVAQQRLVGCAVDTTVVPRLDLPGGAVRAADHDPPRAEPTRLRERTRHLADRGHELHVRPAGDTQ